MQADRDETGPKSDKKWLRCGHSSADGVLSGISERISSCWCCGAGRGPGAALYAYENITDMGQNWQPGEKVIVHPSVQGEKVKELFGDDVETVYVSALSCAALGGCDEIGVASLGAAP